MTANKDIDKHIDEEFSQRFATHLDTEIMRQKIIGIFNEQVKNVDFAKIIKGYAAEEMDTRLFRSVKYWVIVIVTATTTSAIGFLIAFLFKK